MNGSYKDNNKSLDSLLISVSVDVLMNKVIEFEKESFTDQELLPLIRQKDNKDVRCWAMLKIKVIRCSEDADLIVETLLIDDSRMRELASEIIFNHFENYDKDISDVFNKEEYYKTFVKTVTDINPRVTRNINSCFKTLYEKDKLFLLLLEAMKNETGPFVYYWSLDGISRILDYIDRELFIDNFEFLNGQINKIAHGQDELLKEKVAVILSKATNFIEVDKYYRLKTSIEKLKADKGFYLSQITKNIKIKEDL